MRSPGFLLQKWPKRHEHLVEGCVAAGRVLHVKDVLPYLTGWHQDIIRSWNPPTHPYPTLVPGWVGHSAAGGSFARAAIVAARPCTSLQGLARTTGGAGCATR
jgi:hypothetical protein